MKSVTIFLILSLSPIFIYSQTLTSEQKKVIFDLSIKTSKILSDLILINFTDDKSYKDTICINLLATTDNNNKVTCFGQFFSSFLVSNLQSKLNSVDIKKYNYKVIYKSNSISDNFDFDLNISYFMKDSNLIFSRIDLMNNNKKISLQAFQVSGKLSVVKSLNSVCDNMFFDKIIDFYADNHLSKSFKIYDSNGKEVRKDNSIYYLKSNESYKFRFFLEPKTYLYVFLYDFEKSLFYLVYPNTKEKNKQVTYEIKDIKNILFSDINRAVIKIVVSNKKLEVNDDKNNTVSPKQAEKIYEELTENKNYLSISNFNIEFK